MIKDVERIIIIDRGKYILIHMRGVFARAVHIP